MIAGWKEGALSDALDAAIARENARAVAQMEEERRAAEARFCSSCHHSGWRFVFTRDFGHGTLTTTAQRCDCNPEPSAAEQEAWLAQVLDAIAEAEL